jgi:hypothetical protein
VLGDKILVLAAGTLRYTHSLRRERKREARARTQTRCADWACVCAAADVAVLQVLRHVDSPQEPVCR